MKTAAPTTVEALVSTGEEVPVSKTVEAPAATVEVLVSTMVEARAATTVEALVSTALEALVAAVVEALAAAGAVEAPAAGAVEVLVSTAVEALAVARAPTRAPPMLEAMSTTRKARSTPAPRWYASGSAGLPDIGKCSTKIVGRPARAAGKRRVSVWRKNSRYAMSSARQPTNVRRRLHFRTIASRTNAVAMAAPVVPAKYALLQSIVVNVSAIYTTVVSTLHARRPPIARPGQYARPPR
jgi:hypothetical protein